MGDVKWVACGDGDGLSTNTILWSTDGRVWNDASSGGFDDFGISVAYGNGIWVAVGNGVNAQNSIQWSPNGKVWYDASSGGFTGGDGYGGVAYGNENWVAIGGTSGTNSIQWSSDGKSWQDASSGGFGGGGYYYGVAYDGKGLWVASGNGTSARNSIQWSTDGRTWHDASRGGFDDGDDGYNGQGVAYGDNKWVVVGTGSTPETSIQWSPDGKSWYDVSRGGFDDGGGGYYGQGVAYNGKDRWVAVGDVESPEKSILWSPNGLTWYDASNGFFDSEGIGVAYDGTAWVAVGFGDFIQKNDILWSPDGRTWYDASSGRFGGGGGYGVASTRQLYPDPNPLPCFVSGTRILTPAGYKKVEEIETGDYVVTADRRNVNVSMYRFTVASTTEETAPYTIYAGALGNYLPSRDLHISGNHAIQDSTGAWQIPKFLANKNPRVTQHALGNIVTYYHIECENYFKDNLVAEGVVAESYNHSKQSVVWKKSARGYVRRQHETPRIRMNLR